MKAEFENMIDEKTSQIEILTSENLQLRKLLSLK